MLGSSSQLLRNFLDRSVVSFAIQISARLTERRIVVEKEVLKYGEAPAGIKEVFELCRGFERAYVSFTNVSIYNMLCTIVTSP